MNPRILIMVIVLYLTGCRAPQVVTSWDDTPWGEEAGGLRSKLFEVENNYAKGHLKLISLVLENVSNSPILYDPQQVDCNDSLIVQRADGTIVPYREDQYVSTDGEVQTINPGTIIGLFNRQILEAQYDISKPGGYRVQFRGLKGRGVDSKNAEAGPATLPPSNTIKIWVK